MRNNFFVNIKYIELYACGQVIVESCRTPEQPIKDIILSVSSVSAFGGNIPVKDGLRFCQSLGFIEIDNDSNVKITDKIFDKNSKLAPSKEMLRKIAFEVLAKVKMPWLIFLNQDFNLFRLSIPKNWKTILDNLGLLEFEDEVLEWWSKLFIKYQAEKEAELRKVGEIGENIVFKIEKMRVKKNGFNPLLCVKWASQFDDSLGYDILSVKGKEIKGEADSNLFIEVKSSQNSNLSNFYFYISRNEWEKAQEHPEDFYFYFVLGVSNDGNYEHGPFILKVSDINSIIPLDQDSNGVWQNSQIKIDINQNPSVFKF